MAALIKSEMMGPLGETGWPIGSLRFVRSRLLSNSLRVPPHSIRRPINGPA